jgi:putative protease
MCVSVSGRCFLSQFQYGCSANRGQCIQPCRREYYIADKEEDKGFVVGSDYILSPEDLCTLPFIEKLIESGAVSFKIEGRNRSPEYVSVVVGAYRRAVDFYYENKGKRGLQGGFKRQFDDLKKELIAEVSKVYNRGFSSGFYMGRPIDAWTDAYGSKAMTRKEYVGYVVNFFRKPMVAEIRVESNGFVSGDEIMFQGPTTGVLSQKVDSIEVHHKPVKVAKKGSAVAVKADDVVRKNDKVYVIVSSR